LTTRRKHKAGISTVTNITLQRKGKKREREKEVITAEGIRIWSPSQVGTPPNRV